MLSKARAFPFLFYVGGRVSECQRKNQEALAKPNQNEFLPRCKSDGRYEEVQCQSSSGECWCVDQEGKEIPRTRTAKILKCPVIGEVYSARPNVQLFVGAFFKPCISAPVKSNRFSVWGEAMSHLQRWMCNNILRFVLQQANRYIYSQNFSTRH